jgi:hypothetical protein
MAKMGGVKFNYINLPKSQRPVFPDKCIECQTDFPDSSLKIPSYQNFTYEGGVGSFPILGESYKIEAPVHKSCASKFKFKSFMKWPALFVYMSIFASVLILSDLKIIAGSWALVAAIVCYPSAIITTLIAHKKTRFFFTGDGDSVCYYFIDKNYAEELNHAILNEQGKSHFFDES